MRLHAGGRDRARSRAGARGDRRFYVIDERDRMVNGKHVGELQTVRGRRSTRRPARWRCASRTAARCARRCAHARAPEIPLLLPRREGRVARRARGRRRCPSIVGQRAAAGRARASAVDRGARGGGVADLARVAGAAGRARPASRRVDARRFRMLIEIDGVDAHAEDALGRAADPDRRGRGARSRPRRALPDHQPRSRHRRGRPADAGRCCAPTGGSSTRTEPLPFGIYGEVLEPGRGAGRGRGRARRVASRA